MNNVEGKTRKIVLDMIPTALIFDSFKLLEREYIKCCTKAGPNFRVKNLSLNYPYLIEEASNFFFQYCADFSAKHIWYTVFSKVGISNNYKSLLRRGLPYSRFGGHQLSREVVIDCGDNAHRGKLVETHKAQLLLNLLCQGSNWREIF